MTADPTPIVACPVCGCEVREPMLRSHMDKHAGATPPPGYQDLDPALPEPPWAHLGGRGYVLERVSLGDLADGVWQREHGVQRQGPIWMGRLGYVSIYETKGDRP